MQTKPYCLLPLKFPCGKRIIHTNNADIRRIAQHELTHILGAPDCGEVSDDPCIMGEQQTQNSIVNNMILCDHCVRAIKELKSSFYKH